MTEWISEAEAEINQLTAAAKADGRGFYGLHGEQPGARRVLVLAPKLEEMARRVRDLVRA